MALYYDLPIYKDVYSLILLLYQYSGNFPREYKYTIGQDIKRDALVLVRGVYRVNKAKEKHTHFDQLQDDFELIKFQIRLCADMHLFSLPQHANLIKLLDSVGKQINGWQKANERSQNFVG